MADEGYKYQLSAQVGKNMLNVRADTADEFRTAIDALFGDGAAVGLIAPFNVTTAFPEATVATPAAVTTPGVTGDAPSAKQVAFAKQLGIVNPEAYDRKTLSGLIDQKVNK